MKDEVLLFSFVADLMDALDMSLDELEPNQLMDVHNAALKYAGAAILEDRLALVDEQIKRIF